MHNRKEIALQQNISQAEQLNEKMWDSITEINVHLTRIKALATELMDTLDTQRKLIRKEESNS